VLYERFVANRRASSNDSRDQCGCYRRDYLGEHALSRKLSRRFARDRSAVPRLSYVLPRVLPVLCPRCRARMRFRLSQIDDRRQLFAYVCDRCKTGHEWEGASSGSTLGD
jgi:hypothetical protein